MLSDKELKLLRELRLDLLHVWGKFKENEPEKSKLSDYQNSLDDIIQREARIIEQRKELLK